MKFLQKEFSSALFNGGYHLIKNDILESIPEIKQIDNIPNLFSHS